MDRQQEWTAEVRGQAHADPMASAGSARARTNAIVSDLRASTVPPDVAGEYSPEGGVGQKPDSRVS